SVAPWSVLDDVGLSLDVPSLPGWLPVGVVEVDDVEGPVGVGVLDEVGNVVLVIIEVIVTSPLSDDVGDVGVEDDDGGGGGGVEDDDGGGGGVDDDDGGGGVDDVDDVGGGVDDDDVGTDDEGVEESGADGVLLLDSASWATTATGVDAARMSASNSAGATAFIVRK
ncbi:hypothetical protein GGI21_005189, partial [Coemansia aciculifera]